MGAVGLAQKGSKSRFRRKSFSHGNGYKVLILLRRQSGWYDEVIPIFIKLKYSKPLKNKQ